jgi:chaperonin GroEL
MTLSSLPRPNGYRHGVAGDERDIAAFDRGIYALATLIKPVYGPINGVVANAGPTGRSAPELLTDGATIARRLTEIEPRVENSGAMYLRGLLWDVHRQVSDGTSTAAIVFEAMYREGRRGIGAGLNAARLREHLRHHSRHVHIELERQCSPLSGRAALQGLARSVCGDEALARAIADVYAGVGIHSQVDVRPSRTDRVGYDFLGDSYWKAHSLDNGLVRGLIGQRVELSNCAIFVSDLDLDEPHLLISVLTAARNRGADSLLLIGRSLSKQCLGLLAANSSSAFPIYAMSTPDATPIHQIETMDDIATIAGAVASKQATGAGPDSFKENDLGFCRRGWVSRTHFGLFAGQGASESLRQRIRELRVTLRNTRDREREKQLSLRLSRLTARSAVLWIDGGTERIVEDRKRLAERTCRVVRNALNNGVLPGAGIALLECSRSIDPHTAAVTEPEEAFALHMLRYGLEAPVRTLAQNNGQSPGVVITQSLNRGLSKTLSQPPPLDPVGNDEGILDSFEVITAAWQHAVSGVAQALTIGAIVFPRSPTIASAP